jgi:hypothetical protein
MDRYCVKRQDEDGVTDATVNRELSILRTAFHNARKRTPPKVGFLTDEQYDKLRDSLPQELKALFDVAEAMWQWTHS